MSRSRPPPVTAAEAALLRTGLTNEWGFWRGSEKSVDELRAKFSERTHGNVEEILARLVDRGLAHEVDPGGKYALTELGFKAAQHAKAETVEILQDSVDETEPPVPSWFPYPDQIENASGAPWDAESEFREFVVKTAGSNKAIREELIKRMNNVLERPGRYGDFYEAPQVRKCRLAHNQRIRWRYEDEGEKEGPGRVTFIDVKSREDKDYSLS